jgi:hypothetical protein
VENLPLLFIEATSLGASGSDIPPQGASGSCIPVDWEPVALAYHLGELSEPGEAEKITWGQGLTTCEKPTYTFYRGHPLGASSSDIPPQGAGGSSKPVDWEPTVLAYHNRELVVQANLRMTVTLCM